MLAPDWEEWRRPGIVNYSNASDFGAKLARLMDEHTGGIAGAPPNVALSRAYVREHLGLRLVNKERWSILNKLWKLRRESVWSDPLETI